MADRFQRGDILWVELPQRVPPGHEQIGHRPVVVVAVPKEIQPLPYPVLIVVPLTRTLLQGPLFPVLSAGAGGLPVESTALVYQVLALDARRVKGLVGRLTPEQYAPIREDLRGLFDLGTRTEEGQR